MIGLFKRAPAPGAPDTGALGQDMVALRMPAGSTIPSSCTGVAFDRGGRTRRMPGGGRLALDEHESGCCFHPGPYCIDLLPFEAAPELGLRLTFSAGSADPRVEQQRFDLYLASEAGSTLAVADIGRAMEDTLQRELAQGNLELPPCTTLEEWHAFRSGFDQLLYTRFGVIADDCVPVDLGDCVDYAGMLLARALPSPEVPLRSKAAAAPASAPGDAQALRRLFLELPCLSNALRLAALPEGQGLFRQQQELLQRLDQVSLDIATMPALELAAPGRTLDPARQAERAAHSAQAVAALDEGWALMARLALASADQLAQLFDEADRIVANLEYQSAARRVAEGVSA